VNCPGQLEGLPPIAGVARPFRGDPRDVGDAGLPRSGYRSGPGARRLASAQP
jgi:hypothetical protein